MALSAERDVSHEQKTDHSESCLVAGFNQVLDGSPDRSFEVQLEGVTYQVQVKQIPGSAHLESPYKVRIEQSGENRKGAIVFIDYNASGEPIHTRWILDEEQTAFDLDAVLIALFEQAKSAESGLTSLQDATGEEVEAALNMV